MNSGPQHKDIIVDWIDNKLELPVFASAYKGAHVFMTEKPPGYISFVCHAGRDLMNLLANVYLKEEAARVRYFELVNDIEDLWKDDWGRTQAANLNDQSIPLETDRLVPITLCVGVGTLVSEHRSGKKRNENSDIRFFTAFLNYKHRNLIPHDMFQEWSKARKWFVAHAHLGDRTFDLSTEKELAHHFQTLERALHAAATSTSKSLINLNEILEETNS